EGNDRDAVVPPARRVIIPGSGHVIHRTHPRQFVDTVVAFLDGAGQGTPVTTAPPKPSPIADEGTRFFAGAKAKAMLPRGAAIVTSSGRLAATGITHVIHAATGSM